MAPGVDFFMQRSRRPPSQARAHFQNVRRRAQTVLLNTIATPTDGARRSIPPTLLGRAYEASIKLLTAAWSFTQAKNHSSGGAKCRFRQLHTPSHRSEGAQFHALARVVSDTE